VRGWALGLGLLAGCVHAEAPQQTPPLAEAERVMLASASTPIVGSDSDYDALLAEAGQARFVLLGENSHGTADYYRERARITLRLVRERGFRAVAIEGDWPEVERANRYVRWMSEDASADQALSGFTRFPRWMWRNAEFAELIDALREHNRQRPPAERVGVYGMDVYNLFEAADAVVAYLEQSEPGGAALARTHYRCFEPYEDEPQAYGAAARRPERSCEDEAARVLQELQAEPRPADPEAAEIQFSAVRNAAHVAAAEAYYRALYAGSYSWNVRDTAMLETVEAVAAHVGALAGGDGKVVVWAHNTHVGDARATDAAWRGELNLGQLLKERHDGRTLSVGFLTRGGTVMAAPEWGENGRVYAVQPARPDSYAALFREAGLDRALVLTRQAGETLNRAERLQRAIGVIYLPDQERTAHYFDARIAEQFDAVIYLDQTEAVTPLP